MGDELIEEASSSKVSHHGGMIFINKYGPYLDLKEMRRGLP